MTSVVFTPALESIDGVDVELAGDLAGMQFYVMSWLHRISEKAGNAVHSRAEHFDRRQK